MSLTPTQVAHLETKIKVISHLQSFFDDYKEPIMLSTPLLSLGCDMLDRIMLALDFEDMFNIDINDELMEHAHDVSAVVHIVQSSAKKGNSNDGMVEVVTKPVEVTSSEPTKEVTNVVAVEIKDEFKFADEVSLPEKKKWGKKPKSHEEYEELINSGAIDHTEGIKKMLADAGQLDAYVIVPADAQTIQIDLDELEDVKFFQERHKILSKHLKIDISNIVYTRSKSMRWHVTIKLKVMMSDLERVLIQAILGSDRMRELMNYIGIKKGHINPILLLERKEEWEKVNNAAVNQNEMSLPATQGPKAADEMAMKKMPQLGVSTVLAENKLGIQMKDFKESLKNE